MAIDLEARILGKEPEAHNTSPDGAKRPDRQKKQDETQPSEQRRAEAEEDILAKRLTAGAPGRKLPPPAIKSRPVRAEKTPLDPAPESTKDQDILSKSPNTGRSAANMPAAAGNPETGPAPAKARAEKARPAAETDEMLGLSRNKPGTKAQKHPEPAAAGDGAKEPQATGTEDPQTAYETIESIRGKVQESVNPEEGTEEYYAALEENERKERTAKRRRILNRIVTVFLILACIYVIYLIYGVAITEYGYNERGELQPIVVQVDDLRAIRDYDVIRVQYEKIRMLYELILQKDAILGAGAEDYVTLGAEYAAIMDTAEDLGVKTSALVCDSKYNPTKDLMYSWIHDYCWQYLTAITQALTADDATAADAAVVYKNYMYSEFATLTNNVISLGEGINGTDLSDIKSWNPDQYKADFLNGKY